jgi:hypothetical protein
MPATATGRGAQVVLDPIGDHAKAARGAYAATLELNLAKRRADVAAGTVADGNTSDGRTNTGVVATDIPVSPATTLPPNAANDAAAASAGVPVGGTYRNGSVMMVRTV